MTLDECTQDLLRIRRLVLRRSPFFGVKLMGLKLAASTDVPTAATDGKSVIANPDFWANLREDHRPGLLVHEAMHVACQHQLRRGDRDPRQWNIACDYAINPVILKSGYTLPEDALVDQQYANMSAEQIYAMRQSEEQEEPGPGEPGDGQSGLTADQIAQANQGTPTDAIIDQVSDTGEPLTPQEKAREIGIAECQNKQASMVARAAGSTSPEMLDTVDLASKRSQIPWRELLAQYIDQLTVSDYSFSRPDRRFIHRGMYLPGPTHEETGTIALFVDTSGSIDVDCLEAFKGHLDSIRESFAVYVLGCSTRITGEGFYGPEETIDWQANPGGGTSFIPPFQRLAESGRDVDVILYLTDGYCSSFPDAPSIPVIWCIEPDGDHTFTPPFGRVIQTGEF